MKYAPWCLMAFLFMTGIACAEEEAPPDIQRYIDAAKKLPDGVNETVWQMLTEAGRTEGFRGGKAQRAWELRQALTAREQSLISCISLPPHQPSGMAATGHCQRRLSGHHYRQTDAHGTADLQTPAP